MTAAPFEIKVVYDATQRTRRGAVVRSTSARSARAPGTALALGGLLNFAIAGIMYFVTWQMADPFLGTTMIKKTPMDVSAKFAANPFGITSSPSLGAIEPESPPDQESLDEKSSVPRWGGKTAQWLVPVTAFGWLALTTAGGCAVALAGGSWLGHSAGGWFRRLGLLGTVILAVGLSLIGWKLWAEYKTGYKVEHLRYGMGGITLLFAFLGLAMVWSARGITKFAGITVILAALGTTLGIWLWTQSGALDLQYAAWPRLAAAFGIHAAWGVVLLLTANRIRT
jgi:hypothetical protein